MLRPQALVARTAQFVHQIRAAKAEIQKAKSKLQQAFKGILQHIKAEEQRTFRELSPMLMEARAARDEVESVAKRPAALRRMGEIEGELGSPSLEPPAI